MALAGYEARAEKLGAGRVEISEEGLVALLTELQGFGLFIKYPADICGLKKISLSQNG